MYKRIKGKKFSRTVDQRRAFMRSLANNLIMQERIKTTKVRARQTAAFVEKLITKAKLNTLAAKKALASILPQEASRKLVNVIAPRFKDRKGGYTRVIKIGMRAKDAAPIAIVELVDRPESAAPAVAPAKAKKANKKEPKAKAAKETKETKPAAQETAVA